MVPKNHRNTHIAIRTTKKFSYLNYQRIVTFDQKNGETASSFVLLALSSKNVYHQSKRRCQNTRLRAATR